MRRNKNIVLVNTLHPNIRSFVTSAIDRAEEQLEPNVLVHITQAMRTFKEQSALYAKGRTLPGGIVTNAKQGQSYHNYGLAVDIVMSYDGVISWDVNNDWKLVADIFKREGFVWGGDFKKLKDYPHFEMTFGLNWRELLSRYDQKIFLDETEFVRI